MTQYQTCVQKVEDPHPESLASWMSSLICWKETKQQEIFKHENLNCPRMTIARERTVLSYLSCHFLPQAAL